ncbi:hypothetical protein DM01DRAFT_1004366 [Hesseltinella vesiculosa]|uniref:FHA domain-containing protein n=1 Tax=Hesseltinella vesiculosa TaxID=101127 RepID=A0A1X2GYK9_9FUNG|nr:hypothetical protein DM01DRAFT_1004366 [Hesseltinella vesiculosa]
MTSTRSATKEANTFTRHEKQMGLHLLTMPESPVHVRSTPVPEEKCHLYPKLVASNWSCYITGDTIVLGRASVDGPSPKVDVDFHTDMRISRKHAVIKYNKKKSAWELHVFGRNGVKVNHTQFNRSSRVPLTTMTYLNVGDNEFIFVLPESTAKPEQIPSRNVNTTATASTNVIARPKEQQPTEQKLLDLILQVYQTNRKPSLTTQTILNAVMALCKHQGLPNEYTLETMLRALVMDEQYQVAESSFDLTAKQAPEVQWLRPAHLPPLTPETSVSKGHDDKASNDGSMKRRLLDDDDDFVMVGDDDFDQGSVGSWVDPFCGSLPSVSSSCDKLPAAASAKKAPRTLLPAPSQAPPSQSTISPAGRTLSTLSSSSYPGDRWNQPGPTDAGVQCDYSPFWQGPLLSRGQSLMNMYECVVSNRQQHSQEASQPDAGLSPEPLHPSTSGKIRSPLASTFIRDAIDN